MIQRLHWAITILTAAYVARFAQIQIQETNKLWENAMDTHGLVMGHSDKLDWLKADTANLRSRINDLTGELP